MTKSFWILLSFIVMFFSCSKEEEIIVVDTTSEYAGMEVGKYVIFDVDSITFDDFDSSVDTANYQIKEVVDSKITDSAGEEAFKIIRYRRDSVSGSWNLIDVWTAKLTITNFQKTEENIKYLKLIFPAKDNKTWDGNSMNNIAQQDYEYIYVDQSETIGGNALGSVLQVLQEEDEGNLINPKLFEEKYAKGIGLVYKKSKDLTRANLSAPWLGYDITMTLSSYGG